MEKKLCSKVFLLLALSGCDSLQCDRRPYGSSSQASPPDGRYTLSVLETDNTYIPDQLYTVNLRNTDGVSLFTSFIISAEGNTKPDARNPQRLITQLPGELRPSDFLTAKFSDRCPYSVEEAANNLKTSVGVYWQAPPPGNGCVTLRAMVAEDEHSWVQDGTYLTTRICEDTRQANDSTPQINLACQICDEAKYEITFTGVRSQSMQPLQDSENDWAPRYSKLIGASHTADYVLWAPGLPVSPGLRDLIELSNSTTLEGEIKKKIGKGVRTLFKGKIHTHAKLRNSSYIVFRADKNNHLITAAVALQPTNDWFLGVTRFELCQKDNTWLQDFELNLLPWDAGIDSGTSFESANIETFSEDVVSRRQINSYDENSPYFDMKKKDHDSFVKVNIKLLKTYYRDCDGSVEGEEEIQGTMEESSDEAEPTTPSSSEASISETEESSEDCPMSRWQAWSPCEGECEDGHVMGYRWRERYHLVDGVAVEKYDPNERYFNKKEVPAACKEKYDDFEWSECTEDCLKNSQIIKPSRRVYKPILTGHPWNPKKRDALPRIKN